MKLAVCWKWVSLDRDRHHDGDVDERWAGVSAADEAALEIALRLAEAAPGDRADHEVAVWCLGPVGADDTLRAALAAGADRAGRIDAATELGSRTVADALAAQLDGTDLVVCGDYSLDRGTGSVPAFLAAELGTAQALGLVEVADAATGLGDDPPRLRVVRRLDAGRREVLDLTLPAVLSVEGSIATLRRSSLAAELAARTTPIATVPGPHGRLPETEVRPYRPRPRTLPAPAGDLMSRVRSILDIGGADSSSVTVALEPREAAQRIVDQLVDWGYLAGRTDGGSG